jgi:hypothetical protein
MTPIEYPKVAINGRELTLRFSMLAKYQMSRLGIRASDFRSLANPENPDPAVVSLMMRLFSCAVADNFMDVDRPSAPVEIPTPEYWAATIPDTQWPEVCKATMQAMVKAIPSGAALPLAEAAIGAQPLN